jgi:hypothetical protein
MIVQVNNWMAYIIDWDFQQGLKFQPDDNFPIVHFYNIDL